MICTLVVMVIFDSSLTFASSSKELSSHEPMDTGKSTEKTTNKRYTPPYNRFCFFKLYFMTSYICYNLTFRQILMLDHQHFLQCSREKEGTRRTRPPRKHSGERERVCS